MSKEKRSYFRRNPIKTKLTIITLSVSLALAIAFTSSCLYLFQTMLRDNLKQSTAFNLELIAGNIAKQMDSIDMLAQWSNNGSVSRFYEGTDDNYKYKSLYLYERLQEEYNNCPAKDYINRIVLFSDVYDKNAFQVISSTQDSHADPSRVICSSSYYEEMTATAKTSYLSYGQTPFTTRGDKNYIIMMRQISATYTSDVIGYVYIEISPTVITGFLTQYNLPEDCFLYVTMEDTTYVLDDETFLPYEGTLVANDMFLIRATGYRDWSIAQNISNQQFIAQRRTYILFLGAVVLILLLFGIFFSFYLNKAISSPIARLQRRIQIISRGDFSYDEGIEWNHELGDVGKGINAMSANISALMDKRLADEKAKMELEYQVLLNQVNPHFLYNTLNSIRWMATIQKADGIVEMTTSLARLLKRVSKGKGQLISLRDELQLLNDYFTLLQYRYGGAIKLTIDLSDDCLYDCQIPEFTLQPLLENACFHGIEPKKKNGHIQIVISPAVSDCYTIEIIDDGIGMSPELIASIMSGERQQETSGLFKEVGIYNVNQRIKYKFGDAYGLHIESVPAEYTRILITLPMNKKESADV